jgi:hypothetical protein
LNKGSLAEKVNQLMLQEAERQEPPPKRLKSGNSEGGEVVKRTALDVRFGNHGRKLLQARLDDSIVRLICVTGIPPSVVDYEQWKDMLAVANSAHCPTSSSAFIDNHIPAEAGCVRTLSIEYLKTCFHLTVSYDGGTTKLPQSVYTIHFTTPEGQSVLIEGDNATAESATVEYISQALLRAMDLVGRLCSSGIASDSAGNTKLARQLVCAVPTIIPMADVCHHLNHLCKDLSQLSMFTVCCK